MRLYVVASVAKQASGANRNDWLNVRCSERCEASERSSRASGSEREQSERERAAGPMACGLQGSALVSEANGGGPEGHLALWQVASVAKQASEAI